MRGSRAGTLLVLVAALSACAADLPADQVAGGRNALSWNEDVDLAALEIAVGSKSSVEQQVLGHLAGEALAAAGADVIDQIDLGGTLEVRDAQLGGLIDLYWEYTGTGWVELLREIGPSRDPEELAEAVTETDLDENGIAWLAPAPADSSFAIATGPEVADGLAVTTISDLGGLLADDTDGVVVCLPEGGTFRDDPTGLSGLGRALESPLSDEQVVLVPAADLVPAVEAGLFCPFGQVLRTSPQLLGADLALLEDDVGAFLIRNPTVTVRAEVLTEFPQVADLLDPVAAALTDEVLQALNAAVVDDGEEPRTVAREWLVDEGFADL
jgi:osmoprotectant transport system substrate-binding protein